MRSYYVTGLVTSLLAFLLVSCSGPAVYNPGDPASDEYLLSAAIRCLIADPEICPGPAQDPGSMFGRVQASANQSIADGSSTSVAMDTISLDTHGFFAGGASGTASIPWTGNYISILGASFAANGTGYRAFSMSRNGSAVTTMNRLASDAAAVTAVTPMYIGSFTQGDSLSAGAFQNSGGNLDLTGGNFSAFQVARLAGAISGAAGVSITTGFSMNASTPTILTWANENFNTAGYYSAGAPTRLTAGQDGTYLILSRIVFATSIFGTREAEILLNGSNLIAHGLYRPDGGFASPEYFSAIRSLSAGDYLELRVTHSSVGALNFSGGDFQLIRLDTNAASFADRPLVVREMSADTSIPDSTDTIVALDNTISADSIFDVSSTTQTTVNESGLYLVLLTGGFSALVNNRRRIRVLKNGATAYTALIRPDAAFDTTLTIAIAMQLNASDFLQYQANQTTGGALNLLKSNTRMTIMKLD